MSHGEGGVVSYEEVADGKSVGYKMGNGAVCWIVTEMWLAEARGSTGRNGARLVLPGIDKGLSGRRGFVGVLHGARIVLPGPNAWREFVGGLRCGKRRWIGSDGQGLGHPQRFRRDVMMSGVAVGATLTFGVGENGRVRGGWGMGDRKWVGFRRCWWGWQEFGSCYLLERHWMA